VISRLRPSGSSPTSTDQRPQQHHDRHRQPSYSGDLLEVAMYVFFIFPIFSVVLAPSADLLDVLRLMHVLNFLVLRSC
jgi:hypothetical protein